MSLICKIFGHKKVIRDWYPTDSVTTLFCDRCRSVLDQRPNPGFIGVIRRIFSKEDPYGEENWDE